MSRAFRAVRAGGPGSARGALGVFVLLAGLVSAPALAQTTLDQAENAYVAVDFEQTVELAARALAEGGHSPAQVARLYELIGLAQAAQEHEGPAREAFVRMLALRPDAEVSPNLAPRLRSPFLEAKGFWASRSSGFGAEARIVSARSAVRVELSDPLGMAQELRVLARPHQTLGPMRERRVPAESSALVRLDELEEPGPVDYAVQVLDEHGNRLIELGTEDVPRVFGQGLGSERGAVPDSSERPRVPTWVWVVGGVVVAGAIGVGLGLALRDEPITLRSSVSFE